MIYAVYIISSSGETLYSYIVSEGKLRLKDEVLMGGFLTAMLQFGEEIFARPQRMDLDGYAISFFNTKINGDIVWVAMITDSTDSFYATERAVREIVKSVRPELEKILEKGLPLLTPEISEALDRKISRVCKRSLRLLPTYRSGGLRTVLLASVVGFLIYGVLSYVVFSVMETYLYAEHPESIMGAGGIITASVVSLLAIIVGVVVGIVAGKEKEGAISGWLAHLYSLVFLIPSWLASMELSAVLTILIFYVSGTATLSAAIGYIIGLWEDSRKLSVRV